MSVLGAGVSPFGSVPGLVPLGTLSQAGMQPAGPAFVSPFARTTLPLSPIGQQALAGAGMIGANPLSENRFIRAAKLALRELGLYKGPVVSAFELPLGPGVLPPKPKKAAARKQRSRRVRRPAAKPAVVTPWGAGMGASATLGMSPFGLPGMGFGQGIPYTVPQVPQINASNQRGITNSPDGATQNVTNRNAFDSGYDGRVSGLAAYPYAGGFQPWQGSMVGYNSTPWLFPQMPSALGAPGASMMGAGYLSNAGQPGFFSSLLGL